MQQAHRYPIGRKVHYRDPSLGHLTSYVRDESSVRPCDWFGKIRHPDQQRDTSLLLAGYSTCPLRSQLSAVQRILESLPDIRYQLRRRLTRNAARFPGIEPDRWGGELTSISNNNADTATFALAFEWGYPPHPKVLTVDWAGGELYDPR